MKINYLYSSMYPTYMIYIDKKTQMCFCNSNPITTVHLLGYFQGFQSTCIRFRAPSLHGISPINNAFSNNGEMS